MRAQHPIVREGPRYRIALIGFILLWLGLGGVFVRGYAETRAADRKLCHAQNSTNANVVHLVERLGENSVRANTALLQSKTATADQKAAARKNLDAIARAYEITHESLPQQAC